MWSRGGSRLFSALRAQVAHDVGVLQSSQQRHLRLQPSQRLRRLGRRLAGEEELFDSKELAGGLVQPQVHPPERAGAQQLAALPRQPRAERAARLRGRRGHGGGGRDAPRAPALAPPRPAHRRGHHRHSVRRGRARRRRGPRRQPRGGRCGPGRGLGKRLFRILLPKRLRVRRRGLQRAAARHAHAGERGGAQERAAGGSRRSERGPPPPLLRKARARLQLHQQWHIDQQWQAAASGKMESQYYVRVKLGCITPYSERPSPKFYATDEGRLTSLNPTAALRRCR